MTARFDTKATRRMLAAMVALPTPAWAHPGHGAGAGLVAGLAHPFTGIDHLVAMALVGVWAALFAPRTKAALLVPGAFVAAMIAGFAVSAYAPGVPAETLILASLAVLGIAAGAGLRAPLPLAVAAAGLFGFGHGLAHGFETPQGAFPALFAGGFLLSTAALHGFGMIAARVLPSWLARGLSVLAAAGALVAVAT
jgi:urease accessory protein